MAPLSIFCRNSAVLARSSTSLSFFIFGSRAPMASTSGCIFLTSRACLVPKNFLSAQLNMRKTAPSPASRAKNRE